MTPLADAAVVLLGGASNTRSVGCPSGSAAPVEGPEILRALAAAARSGAGLAVLVGGEPTLRADLPSVLRATRHAGLVPGLATNGRMLIYDRMRDLLVGAGLAYARVELHGAHPATHDALVGVPGAFEQTWAGLSGLLQRGGDGLRVDVACTVTAHNLGELDELVDRVVALPRQARLFVRFVAPLGTLPAAEWPEARRVSERVGAALERVLGAGASVGAAWEGFPPCLLEGAAPLRDEQLRWGVPVFGPREVGASIPLESPADRAHPYPCQECMHGATCPGAPAAFLDRDGEGALRPSLGVRANSFNYEVERTLEDCVVSGAGECAVPALDVPDPPCRSLVLVRDGEPAVLYRSPTSDFTDDEVRHVKDEIGQLYLDRTAQAALDDFAHTMSRVRPHPECGRCPARAGCPGAFVVDPEPPFRREERWLRKEISRMRGRVLDVGCGEQPYRELVQSLIAEERIEYHGLDPDEEALESMRAAGIGGTLHSSGIEDFEHEPGYFDYVLGLRSINHFRDMDRAFRNISRLMRVEGQLVLCDAPAFGMLRTGAQVRWADDNARHGHEHFRNWSSQQVVELLKRFPFRVQVHRPVTAQTSNQWILRMVRVGTPAAGGATSP